MTKRSIICEGKTSNEAIEKGLKELGCSIDDVNVKILENEDKKIFFSILDPRVVKVELTIKDDIADDQSDLKNDDKKIYSSVSKDQINICKKNIDLFLKDFCDLIGEINFKISDDGNSIVYVDIDGENSSKLIGYRGDSMYSLQTILNSIGNKDIDGRVRVFLNIDGYKEKREESLREFAKKMEDSVAKSKKKVVLEPMNSYDRKIIHTELQNSKIVTTYSVGNEPYRHIVIDLK